MELATLEATSQAFLGQWKRLVSTTNWDKGHIIHQWRTALLEAGAALAEASDDAWSRQVGGVTPQHVGRLRRVFERFGEVHDQYPGLYWSHFQAALDWDDAEMWLEGAVQSEWSISEMRRTRWETLGAPAELQPRDEDIVTGELDEDADPAVEDGTADALIGALERVLPAGQAGEANGAGEHWPETASDQDQGPYADDFSDEPVPADEPQRPFAHLASLPADASEAFESFKLCILKHKLAGWTEVARDDLLAALDALKELALAPMGA